MYVYIYIYVCIYTHIYVHIVLFAFSTFRILFIYLPFSVRHGGKKCFFSIVGKSFDGVVQLTLYVVS